LGPSSCERIAEATGEFVNIDYALAVLVHTLGLPPGLTAATGMDAIAHCMETFMAAAFNPPADGIGLDGLERGWAHIERATRDGQDRDARPRHDAHVRAPERGQHADLRRAEHGAGAEDRLARLQVLARGAHRCPAWCDDADGHAIGAVVGVLDAHDRIGTVGHRRAGHDPHRFAASSPIGTGGSGLTRSRIRPSASSTESERVAVRAEDALTGIDASLVSGRRTTGRHWPGRDRCASSSAGECRILDNGCSTVALNEATTWSPGARAMSRAD